MSETKMINKDVEDLEDTYDNITNHEEGGYIGGYTPLCDLSNKCIGISKRYKEVKIPAFVLSQIFKRIADNQFDRKVDFKESQEIYTTLNAPLKDLFNDLKTGADYHENLNQVIKDFEELFNE